MRKSIQGKADLEGPLLEAPAVTAGLLAAQAGASPQPVRPGALLPAQACKALATLHDGHVSALQWVPRGGTRQVGLVTTPNEAASHSGSGCPLGTQPLHEHTLRQAYLHCSCGLGSAEPTRT